MATCNRTPWGADSRRNGLKVLHGRGRRHLSAVLILSMPSSLAFRLSAGAGRELGVPGAGAGRHHSLDCH